MSATASPDRLLQAFPSGLWRALPAVALSSAVVLMATAAAVHGLPPGHPGAPLLVALLAGPALAPALVRVAAEIDPRGPRVARPFTVRAATRAAAVTVVPGLSLTFLALAPFLSGSGAMVFAGLALLGAIATTSVAVVALPLALERPEARLRSVWTVSATATMRSPLPPLSVVVFTAVASWLVTGWAVGMLVCSTIVALALVALAAWACLDRTGVQMTSLPVTS